MLLEELVLHNFGIYKGRHCIDLSPKTPNKPIVLFGALNGGGKTTLLDALKLALYGKFAHCSNRGNLSYPDFLGRTINHQVDSSEGASVELQFRHRRDGTEDTIRVIRAWRSTGKGLKETTDVLRNGKLDSVIADRWYEYIEEFIPVQVSNLFFFDGEKIESLASEEQSAELIRTGLHALLGLDLVDRVTSDLRAFEAKRKVSLSTSKEQNRLSELQQHISALQDHRTELTNKLASEKTNLQNILNRIKRLRDEFRREGGELLEQRDTIETEAKSTEHRLADAEAKLRELASGASPLLLVRDILRSAQDQAKTEKKLCIHKSLRTTLHERDKQIVQSLRKKVNDDNVVNVLVALLKKDIADRDRLTIGDIYLHIDPDVFSTVNSAILTELGSIISDQIEHTVGIREQLSELHRKLAAIPDPTSLTNTSKSLRKAEAEKKEAEIKTAVLERELETLSKQINIKEKEHFRYMERVTEQIFVDETNSRVLKHSSKLRDTLSTFRQRVAEKHIKQLERLILESFNQVVRKPDLIRRISIAPDSYALTLYTKTGDILPPERLSAGERQLLAISILWGLAKASDRPLPAVIDTPLGRLDSNHRNHLVSNYFPYASHQVLLLSTDEEIDQRYYSKLSRFVTHEYNIEYKPEVLSSSVTPGYFWKGQ